MQSLKQVLMNRDKLTEAEAEEFIAEARERIYSGDCLLYTSDAADE